MTTTTTAQAIDTIAVTPPSTLAAPTPTADDARRLPRRTTWILGGALTVAVVAGASGVGIGVYEASRTPTAVTPIVLGAATTGAVGATADDVVHGAGSIVVTGSGTPVGASTTRSSAAADLSGGPTSDEADDVAHGAGSVVVTGTGQAVR